MKNRLLFALLFLGACSTPDPILEGDRSPIFKQDALVVLDEKVLDLGNVLTPTNCEYAVDANNRIWHGNVRIFSGLPTEAKIKVDKKTACNGKNVYAGLSTGELVKVNATSREMAWAVDIFQPFSPTKNAMFLDIIATPVYHAGFVYAGGLGNQFCKVRDSDGKKIWCLPVAVVAIVKSTDKFHVIKSADGAMYAVSTDGRVYRHDN